MIKPTEVELDTFGYWMHPDYFDFWCECEEEDPPFRSFAKKHGLEWAVVRHRWSESSCWWREYEKELGDNWVVAAVEPCGLFISCGYFVRNNEVTK